MNLVEPRAWIIANVKDPELLWSKEQGWVDSSADYDTYDYAEAAKTPLPMDGEWERVSKTHHEATRTPTEHGLSRLMSSGAHQGEAE